MNNDKHSGDEVVVLLRKVNRNFGFDGKGDESVHFTSYALQNTDYRSNSKNFLVNTKGYLKGISAPPPIFLGKN